MEFSTYEFNSGLRFLHLPANGQVIHLAVYINAGTRDEDEGKSGLAHFIEHTIFKGTTHRKAYHVLTRLETVGGELNAFTTKEETCIFATVLKEHFHRALELIADIILHPTFPEKELKKEKDVILDEINSYRDNPADEIYDILEEHIFSHHALGRNILGQPGQIENFTRGDVTDFIRRNYTAGRMVVCSIGDLQVKKAKHLVERYFGGINGENQTAGRKQFTSYRPFSLTLDRTTFQTHCMIGNIAYDRNDPRRFPLFLLNNILGGPAMNSRLNLAVRERHGYAYTVESAYLPYTDSGIFSIYFGTDPENLEKSIHLIHREMEKLRLQKLGHLQLSQAKKQLIGQIEIANESNMNFLMAAGKAYLHDGKLEDSEEIRRKIEAITGSQIMETAQEIFDPARMSRLVFNSNNNTLNKNLKPET